MMILLVLFSGWNGLYIDKQVVWLLRWREGWVGGRMDGWMDMDEQTDELIWMDGWMDKWMGGWTDGWMDLER